MRDGRRAREVVSRLLRILPNAATAVSLMLCVATIAVWVRSDPTPYWMTGGLPSRVSTWDGSICFGRTYPPQDGARYFRVPAMPGPANALYSAPLLALTFAHQQDLNRVEVWRGLGWAQVEGAIVPPHGWDTNSMLPTTVIPYRVWRVPLWCPFLLFALLPGYGLYKAARARYRQRRCLCPACGYDLRATPDRCPECGTAPTAPH